MASAHLTSWQLYVVGFLVGILHRLLRRRVPVVPARARRSRDACRRQLEARDDALCRRSPGRGISGGLIAAPAGAPYAILVDSCSFFVSGGFLRRSTSRGSARSRPRRARDRLRAELWEGLLYVVKHHLRSAAGDLDGHARTSSRTSRSRSSSCSRSGRCTCPGLIGVVFALGSIGWLAGRGASRRAPSDGSASGGATILGAALSGPGTLLVALTPEELPGRRSSSRAPIIGGFGAVVYNIQQVSPAPGDHARADAGPDELRDALPRLGADPARLLVGGAIATAFGLRTALVVGAVGGFTSVIRSSSRRSGS